MDEAHVDDLLDSVLHDRQNGGVGMDVDDDEIVTSIDVVLSQTLADQLYVMQYPLRPLWRPYDNTVLDQVRFKSGTQVLEMEYRLKEEEKQEEQSTKILSATTGAEFEDATKEMKAHVVRSTVVPNKSNYLVGLYRGGQLHVTPLKGVLQMRPSFAYIDQSNEEKRKRKEAESAAAAADMSAAGIRASMDDMDNTGGSKGPEDALKPVAIQVKKKETERATQMRLKSYAYLKQLENEEHWTKLDFIHRDRIDSMSVFEKLAARDTSDVHAPHLPNSTYLDTINPPLSDDGTLLTLADIESMKPEDRTKSRYARAEVAEFKSRQVVYNQLPPAMSLHTIHQLNPNEEIAALFNNTNVLTYSMILQYSAVKEKLWQKQKELLMEKLKETLKERLAKMAEREKNDFLEKEVEKPEHVRTLKDMLRAATIAILESYAVLVHGVWVVKSGKSYRARASNVRDWILCLIANSTPEFGDWWYLSASRLAEPAGCTAEFVKSIIDPITDFIPGKGRVLKYAPDSSYLDEFSEQENKWSNFWSHNKDKLEAQMKRWVQPLPDEATEKRTARTGPGGNILARFSASSHSATPSITSLDTYLSSQFDIGEALASHSLSNFARIDVSAPARNQLDKFLEYAFANYGVLTPAGLVHLSKLHPEMITEAPPFTEELATQELSNPLFVKINKTYVLKTVSDSTLNTYRDIVLSLFRERDSHTRTEVAAAFRLKTGKEPNRNIFARIVTELIIVKESSWTFKSGAATEEEMAQLL